MTVKSALIICIFLHFGYVLSNELEISLSKLGQIFAECDSKYGTATPQNLVKIPYCISAITDKSACPATNALPGLINDGKPYVPKGKPHPLFVDKCPTTPPKDIPGTTCTYQMNCDIDYIRDYMQGEGVDSKIITQPGQDPGKYHTLRLNQFREPRHLKKYRGKKYDFVVLATRPFEIRFGDTVVGHTSMMSAEYGLAMVNKLKMKYAGEFVVGPNGEIIEWTNGSGHFLPDKAWAKIFGSIWNMGMTQFKDVSNENELERRKAESVKKKKVLTRMEKIRQISNALLKKDLSVERIAKLKADKLQLQKEQEEAVAVLEKQRKTAKPKIPLMLRKDSMEAFLKARREYYDYGSFGDAYDSDSDSQQSFAANAVVIAVLLSVLMCTWTVLCFCVGGGIGYAVHKSLLNKSNYT